MCPHEFYLGTCRVFLKKSSQCGDVGGVRVQGMCPHEFYLGTCTCIFKKIKPRGVWVWSMRGVRVQGMCPHEFYLGTCTCIFKKIKPSVGVGVEYEGCEGARDVST